MSWWADPACQHDRSLFQQQAESRLPSMLADKTFGQRSSQDYRPTFDRAWGPVAAEHRMKKWKRDHNEVA